MKMVRFSHWGLWLFFALYGCANPVWVVPEAAPLHKPVVAPPVVMPGPDHVAVFEISSTSTFKLHLQGKWQTLKNHEDYVLFSQIKKPAVSLEHSDWVFVGYGLTVPALGWDNYRSLDVVGKTVVMLSGAPHINEGAVVDSRTLILHPVARNLGQWQQKIDNAREHGAAMVLIVQDGPKEEWQRLMTFPNTISAYGEDSSLLAWAWLPQDRFRNWLGRSGVSWDRLKARAQAPDFRGISLPLQTSLDLENHWREVEVSLRGD